MALSPTSSRSSGGSSSSIVSCVLACDAGVNIRQTGQKEIFWNALYNNAYDLGVLAAIPTGLGLSFLFDGTSGVITTTTAGTWSFSYAINRAVDATWAGQLFGVTTDRAWQLATNLSSGSFNDVKTDVVTLPIGATRNSVIDVAAGAVANPYDAIVYLSIVRFA